MDPQLALLLNTYLNNTNELPYFLTDVSNDGAIIVTALFRQTQLSDLSQVQNWPACSSIWAPGCSAFHAYWLQELGNLNRFILKLEVDPDPTGEVQGLVRLDSDDPCGDPADHVLEAAPHNQRGTTPRRYGGVGVALVVRMALECFLSGKSVFSIQTNPRNVPFYVSLNFVESVRAKGRLYLSRTDAEQLITKFFFG